MSVLRTITIEIGPDCLPGGFDVVVDDLRCNGLSFDEMLGQVVALTHPKIGAPHYRMQTAEEWAQQSAAGAERAARARAEFEAEREQKVCDAVPDDTFDEVLFDLARDDDYVGIWREINRRIEGGA